MPNLGYVCIIVYLLSHVAEEEAAARKMGLSIKLPASEEDGATAARVKSVYI